jgi:hypothetical protein
MRSVVRSKEAPGLKTAFAPSEKMKGYNFIGDSRLGSFYRSRSRKFTSVV